MFSNRKQGRLLNLFRNFEQKELLQESSDRGTSSRWKGACERAADLCRSLMDGAIANSDKTE